MIRKKMVTMVLTAAMLVSVLGGCGASSKEEKTDSTTASASQAAEKKEDVKTIKVGAIYPVTGNVSQVGLQCVNAVELAAEIVNGSYDLDLPLAKTEGLENLGGAKIEIVTADSEGTAVTGQAAAEQLITQEGVTGIIGCYQSAVAMTVSQVCERKQIPMVCPDCSSDKLRQGYEYFFRTGLTDLTFNKCTMEYLTMLNEKENAGLKTIALVYENGEYGSNAASVYKDIVEDYGFEIVAEVSYTTGVTDVTSEVQKIKSANPDVVVHSSYISDAILFTNAYKTANFAPKVVTGDACFTVNEYLQNVGDDGNYISAFDVWSLDLAGSNPLIKEVNDLYFEKYGVNMTGVTARTFIGAIVMFNAINEAGSTDTAAIKDALLATDIDKSKLIATWGVKFDPETHENNEVSAVMTQILDQQYKIVFPEDAAVADYVFPYPSWSER